MSDVTIQAVNLSKTYRIGEAQKYKALRDTLTDLIYAPFRGLRSVISPDRQNKKGSDDTLLAALKDVSFNVRRGEVVGVIGRNGAGKTTLLKVLSRITRPTDGYAVVRGRMGSLIDLGTGFHPELTGRPLRPQPLFMGLIAAAVRCKYPDAELPERWIRSAQTNGTRKTSAL